MADPVNHPEHYCQGKVECLDAIESAIGKDSFDGFLVAQVIKYIWRYKLKGKPAEDLDKASFYLNKLIARVKNG